MVEPKRTLGLAFADGAELRVVTIFHRSWAVSYGSANGDQWADAGRCRSTVRILGAIWVEATRQSDTNGAIREFVAIEESSLTADIFSTRVGVLEDTASVICYGAGRTLGIRAALHLVGHGHWYSAARCRTARCRAARRAPRVSGARAGRSACQTQSAARRCARCARHSSATRCFFGGFSGRWL